MLLIFQISDTYIIGGVHESSHESDNEDSIHEEIHQVPVVPYV